MALSVVESACQFASALDRGVITIESDLTGPPFSNAFEELQSQAAKDLALSYATQRGVVPAFLNSMTVQPYPVNSDGLSMEQVRGPGNEPLPQNHPKMQPARYRVDVQVARPFR